MNFLDDLNPQQKKAVTHPAGPLLVLAGAGSGKTRVLTYRIAHLVNNLGVSPKNIIAITFTNKAAEEMQNRASRFITDIQDMLITTFHSACVRFLRRDIDRLGYKRNFIIFDTLDQQVLIKECLRSLNLDDKVFMPRTVLNYIGRAKDRLLTPAKCFDQVNDLYEKTMVRIYELYQKRLKASNALDFDDIIMCTVELLKKHPSILSRYQERFYHVLVDEYQDTNLVQYQLVKMLAGKHQNLCVVGDDDQSIYGFRGADIRNILEFEQDFPDAKVIRLEQNYRSTQNILDAANSVITYNFGRKEKTLWTDKGEGDKINLISFADGYEEAHYIAREINDLVFKKGVNYDEIAVLYRTNFQSRVMEEAMIRGGIPYKIIGGLMYYQRKEIKDILSYMRLITNPSDDVSLARIINVPRRGIGAVTLNKLKVAAEKRQQSIFNIISDTNDLALSPSFKNKLQKFYELIQDFKGKSEDMAIPDLIEYILEKTGYFEKLICEDSVEARSRIENLQELTVVAQEFEENTPDGSLGDFLASLALVSDVDDLEDEGRTVVMMTLHCAKGLEFPIVFLTGMDEGIFPHSRSLLEDDQLEEERRLCYVGITRAQEKLYMTRALSRNIYGNTSSFEASRFLKEIPQEVITETTYVMNNNTDTVNYKSRALQYKNTPFLNNQIIGPLKPGDKVVHTKWGEGIVKDVDGIDEDEQVSVDFLSVGEKHLMLKYAPLLRRS